MKKILGIFLAFSFLLFFACSTAPAVSKTNDGSSIEKAIVITETNEWDGVAAEYIWLDENYPGHTVLGQELIFEEDKPYDIVSIKTQAGETKDIFFDISNFYGKF